MTWAASSFVVLAACDYAPRPSLPLMPPRVRDGGAGSTTDGNVSLDSGTLDGGAVDASPPRDGGTAATDGGAPMTGFTPPFSSNYEPSDVVIHDALHVDCEAFVDTDTAQADAWCGPPPDLHVLSTADGELVLLTARRFEVTAAGRLDVRGSRPLLVIIDGNVLIDGEVTVAHATRSCPGTNGRNDGGGGGGGFGTDGAPGGDADDRGGGDGASANGTPELVPLLTGCAGGDGNAPGGRGGGALEISASGSILVRGHVDAFGEGGRGGDRRAAGGGGGSGGALLLEADVVTVEGGLFANGAGGGQAGGEDDDDDGEHGDDGAAATSVANGGSAGPGATGGDGATGLVEALAGEDGRSGAGGSGGDRPGGGGGGGVGRIRINAHRCALGGEMSPAPSTDC
ncbi:MAG: hypothetical protein RMA76_25280 [Deltaproteobacteria bacterium]|jgi:hypothetical protein